MNLIAEMKDLIHAAKLRDVIEEVEHEVKRARSLWPPHNSAHEAYAVLLEEVEEYWEHVKMNQKKRDIPAMRKELIQVAAMAVRALLDTIDDPVTESAKGELAVNEKRVQ